MKKIMSVIILSIALTGCGDTVYRWQIERAQKYCASHEGIDHIETLHMPVFDTVEAPYVGKVFCTDGSAKRFDDIKEENK